MFKAIAKGLDGSTHYTSEFRTYGDVLNYVFATFIGWDVIRDIEIIDAQTGELVDVVEN